MLVINYITLSSNIYKYVGDGDCMNAWKVVAVGLYMAEFILVHLAFLAPPMYQY